MLFRLSTHNLFGVVLWFFDHVACYKCFMEFLKKTLHGIKRDCNFFLGLRLRSSNVTHNCKKKEGSLSEKSFNLVCLDIFHCWWRFLRKDFEISWITYCLHISITTANSWRYGKEHKLLIKLLSLVMKST